MKRNQFRNIFHSIAPCLFAVVLSCGTYAGNPEGQTGEAIPIPSPMTNESDVDTVLDPAGTGGIHFSITDASVDDVKQLFISVSSIEMSRHENEEENEEENNTRITIPLIETERFDLLALNNGASLALAELNSLPAGTYRQIRLRLDPTAPATVVLPDDTEQMVSLPSADKRGLAIRGEFIIKAGVSTAFTIDFDVRKSLIRQKDGTYKLKPTLRLVADDHAGAIRGEATPGDVVCVYEKGKSKDDDDNCDGSLTSTIVPDGRVFTAAFLPEGDYELRIFSQGRAQKDTPVPVLVSSKHLKKLNKNLDVEEEIEIKNDKDKIDKNRDKNNNKDKDKDKDKGTDRDNDG